MAIERCAQLIKGGFSFAIRKDFPGEIWQDGYHAHRVADEEDLRTKPPTSSTIPRRNDRRLSVGFFVDTLHASHGLPTLNLRRVPGAEAQFFAATYCPGLKSGAIPETSARWPRVSHP